MPRQNNLSVVFYDPSGRGGITQYTYQLAESLACQGSNVTVITTEDYELKHLKRSFKIYIPFKKSWVKSFLNTMFSAFQKKDIRYAGNSCISNANNTLKKQKITLNSLLKINRLWLIWIKI